MKSLGEYQNRNGERFKLALCDGSISPDNDCWEYFLTVLHEKWGKRELRILIKKRIASSKEFADIFVLEAPLRHTKDTIDTADRERFDLLVPPSLDWFVLGSDRPTT